ncbi:hypothetical protein [Companilactobacillus baiquanensis]|uniref:Lumazine-binding domain-containing protein n=1 Tax=Companilactobacillus baiquanensis TaxID=2486005 RepID=A0ABW1UZ25_9LACO|nr:hypothetical protein [Companilactobacillus baiquanensis]
MSNVLNTLLKKQSISCNGHNLTLSKIAPTEFRIDQSNIKELPVGTSINTRNFLNNGSIELDDGTKFKIE